MGLAQPYSNTARVGHPPRIIGQLRKKENFLDDLSNSTWLFDYVVKAGQAARQKMFPG